MDKQTDLGIVQAWNTDNPRGGSSRPCGIKPPALPGRYNFYFYLNLSTHKFDDEHTHFGFGAACGELTREATNTCF